MQNINIDEFEVYMDLLDSVMARLTLLEITDVFKYNEELRKCRRELIPLSQKARFMQTPSGLQTIKDSIVMANGIIARAEVFEDVL